MLRKGRVLVVGRVSYGNLLLCLALSFFFRVQCFSFKNSTLRRLLAGRVSLFDWQCHGDGEVVMNYCWSETVPTWAKKISLRHVPQVSIRGQALDISEKVLKDLGPGFLEFHLYSRFKKDNETYLPGIDAYLIHENTTFPLLHEDPEIPRIATWLNGICEHLEVQCLRLLRTVRDISQLARACAKRHNPRQAAIVVVVAPSEVSLDPRCISFAWLLDGTDLSPTEILYLLPRHVAPDMLREIRARGIQTVGSIFELADSLGWKERASVLFAAVATCCRLALGTLSPSVMNEARQNYPRMLLWSHLKDTLGVRTYVDGIGAATMGSYEVLILRNHGVNTVMHNYSANSRAVSSRIPLDEYHLAYSRILHQYMSVWTEKYADRIRDRYCDTMRFHISGPAMVARPNFEKSELETIRQELGIKADVPAISVFDIPPQMKGWVSGNQSFVASAYTEEFCSAFLEDIFRLFQDDGVTILYKPKRDWNNTNHPCPPRIAKIIQQVEGDSRWVTMPPNSNPWITVLLSDLVVAIPFTSIYQAAMDRAIPFLFHNPGHHLQHHVYGEFEGQTTTSYEELRESTSRCLVGFESRKHDLASTDVDQRLVDFLRDPAGKSVQARDPVRD